MINVEIWYYSDSETRTVRFSRKVALSAVPFTGSYIDLKNDNLKVGTVSFLAGGGIVVVADNDDENSPARPDLELNDFIDEMKDMGWTVLSNVKRRKGIRRRHNK